MSNHSEPPYLPVASGEIGLFTDFYELTMAQSYFTEGMDGEATFEPVLEATGPIIDAQLAETLLVNQVQYQTLLATKSARGVLAARGRPIAGFGATSNVLAARRYGIPPTGTMAHSRHPMPVDIAPGIR